MIDEDVTLFARFVNEDDEDIDNLLVFEIIRQDEQMVTLDLLAKGNVSFVAYHVSIGYNPRILSLREYENGLSNMVNDREEGVFEFNYLDVSTPIVDDVRLLTLTFDRVQNDNTVVSISVIEMIDMDETHRLFDVDHLAVDLELGPKR